MALCARVGKCPERGLGPEWYARGAFVFDTAYITYASEKSTVESFFSHFQIPIRGSGRRQATRRSGGYREHFPLARQLHLSAGHPKLAHEP